MQRRHKRLNLSNIDKVLSKEEVREWFAAYFKIVSYKRFLRFVEIARILGYAPLYIRHVMKGIYPISPGFQVRFTAFVNEYGQPREIAKQPPVVKREIPEEAYKKFAEAIATLPTDMAAFYGINKYIYLSVKSGGVPQFRRATFERLYEKLTGEQFIW